METSESPVSEPARARARAAFRKEYFSIGEACELLDLKPHVLRYWETQFPGLNPSKNRSGNRIYQRKEIKLLLLVKHLLYEDRYTIEGARARLKQLRKAGELQNAAAKSLSFDTIDMIRDELRHISDLLAPPEHHSN
jgi:DNA-binding transcriptional MerR regulator